MGHVLMEGVGLDFPIYDSDKSFRKALLKTARSKVANTGGVISQGRKKAPTAVRALENINLEIRDGDRLGLIGHNGSGKTTLLKVMSGIYEPTSGYLESSGRITPMFNPSIGMDQDDTGYENITNIGLFLGLSEAEINARIPDIEDFAELGDFLSLPVRIYSAGMMIRLAFGIATSIEPEILILDEGLGAGDARFADKAKQRMDAMVSRASIVVLASHGDELIKAICNKAILLEHGQIVEQGDCDFVIESYHERIARASES